VERHRDAIGLRTKTKGFKDLLRAHHRLKPYALTSNDCRHPRHHPTSWPPLFTGRSLWIARTFARYCVKPPDSSTPSS